jgi:hypothetical protein
MKKGKKGNEKDGKNSCKNAIELLIVKRNTNGFQLK